jgi:DNA polymerase III delta prime subunit
MIYSSDTNKKIKDLSVRTPQIIIFIGQKGSGKASIMRDLGLKITTHKNLSEVQPLEGKKTIGIDQIRDLKKLAFLTKKSPQVILIPNADLITNEAQNSMLKLLEDTPSNLHIFLGTKTLGKLLKTIRSRAYLWRIVNPTAIEVKAKYKDVNSQKIDQAINITSGNSRYLEEYLNNNKAPVNIETAKEILSENKFERLKRVSSLSKDIALCNEIIEALLTICKVTLELAGKNEDIQKLTAWKNRLSACLQALDLIEKSVQPKLVLTRLFMVL